MKCRDVSFALALFTLALHLANAADSVQSTTVTYDFEGDTLDEAPSHFAFEKSASGQPGKWVVQAFKDAPSGRNVLVQTDMDRSQDRFLIAIVKDLKLKDGRICVHCKPVRGERDQACGLVVRYQDANNYYVARSNALEDNVRLYYVRAGKRTQLASWENRIESDTWHTLALEITGDRMQVFFDDDLVITRSDRTFTTPGAAGLWVKADSVTAFDEIEITRLASAR